MALKKKPVTGMKDMLPREMEIRDYLIGLIKETYKTYGFCSIETPCVEHIENLCSKQGGDNEKLIFKILKRGEKLKIDTAKKRMIWWMEVCVTTLPYRLPDIMRTIRMSFRHRSKHCRSGMYGEQTVRRKDVSDSSCSAILIFWVNREILQRLS